MDKLDFLDGAEAPVEDVRAAEPVTAPEAVETPQEQPQIAEVQTPPDATLTPPVVEQSKPDPGFVPITVMLDEREKRQRLEAELAQYRQQQQPPPDMPDPITDPEAHTAYLQQQLDARLWQQTLTISERFAKQAYGAETVDEAYKWAFDKCTSDPIFNAKIRSSDDPYGVAVQEFRREKIAAEVTDTDYEAFKAWKAAQAQLTQPQPAAPAAPEQPPIPSPSIASATSAGGVQHVAVGPGVAFGDAIK